MTQTEKKKALENLEQDAHQLMTASNEGMAPENEHVAKQEPKQSVWTRLAPALLSVHIFFGQKRRT